MREENSKVTFRIGDNEQEIDFVLIKKSIIYMKCEGNPWVVCIVHALVIGDIDKRKIRKVVRKTCTERRNISLLKDVQIWKRFVEK